MVSGQDARRDDINPTFDSGCGKQRSRGCVPSSPFRNRPKWRKWSPIVWAAREGHTQVVRLLLQAGANPDPNAKGYALFWAAREGHTQVVRLLLEAGVI